MTKAEQMKSGLAGDYGQSAKFLQFFQEFSPPTVTIHDVKNECVEAKEKRTESDAFEWFTRWTLLLDGSWLASD